LFVIKLEAKLELAAVEAKSNNLIFFVTPAEAKYSSSRSNSIEETIEEEKLYRLSA
jgi:hypothetical protein